MGVGHVTRQRTKGAEGQVYRLRVLDELFRLSLGYIFHRHVFEYSAFAGWEHRAIVSAVLLSNTYAAFTIPRTLRDAGCRPARNTFTAMTVHGLAC